MTIKLIPSPHGAGRDYVLALGQSRPETPTSEIEFAARVFSPRVPGSGAEALKEIGQWLSHLASAEFAGARYQIVRDVLKGVEGVDDGAAGVVQGELAPRLKLLASKLATRVEAMHEPGAGALHELLVEMIGASPFGEWSRTELAPKIGDALAKKAPTELIGQWQWTADSTRVPDQLANLVRAVWADVVRPRISPPALARAVTNDVTDLFSRRCVEWVGDVRTEHDGQIVVDRQQRLIFPAQRGYVVKVPCIPGSAVAAFLGRGLDLLSSKAGIDTIEHVAISVHGRFVANDFDFRRLSYDGGWEVIAYEKLGMTSKQGPAIVRAVVIACASLQFRSKLVQGNLLSYAEPRMQTFRGARSQVVIVAGEMLTRGFTSKLREDHGVSGLDSREARRLVPILGKTALVGSRRDYAAQQRMVWRFSAALRDRAEELAEYGHVHIPIEAWVTLAEEAGAPRSGDFIQRVRVAWETGAAKPGAEPKPGVLPLIVRVRGERDRVTLHESRKPALDFIVEGGKLSQRKRAAGKAGQRNRSK